MGCLKFLQPCSCLRHCWLLVCVDLCCQEEMSVTALQGDCLFCSSGSPTKRLLQITDMSWGSLAHVPALCICLIVAMFDESSCRVQYDYLQSIQDEP